MARYEVAVTTAAAASGAAFADLRTTANARARVLEVGISNTAATASVFSIERPTTVGTTSTSVNGISGDPADGASLCLVGSAWSGAPANTGNAMRQFQVPANIGAGVIFTWPEGGLIVPVSSSILFMNRSASAAGVSRLYVVWDE